MKRSKSKLLPALTAMILCAALTFVTGVRDVYAGQEVIEGKDGWYFLTYDSTIEDYQGTNLFTDEELSLILQNYLNMRDTLAEEGVEFVVFLAPNKEHIYNEYMPDEYGELAPYTRIQQVYDLLKDYMTVIYPEAMLREAKEKYPYDIYYRSDPHWNGVGTYLCAKVLMESIGVNMPDLETLTITSYETNDLDCAQLLGTEIPDTGYNISGYGMDEPSMKRMVICGDSFGSELSDYIKPVVNDCVIVHRDLFEPESTSEWGADVLVLEVAERYMDGMPVYSCV